MEKTGIVFNIQHYSVHDGPGIRTVVFLKGCPLRCRWCANPESQVRKPQLAWTKGDCIGCKSCKALSDIPHFSFDDAAGPKCDGIVCADKKRVERVCPSRALHVIGEEKTVPEVISSIEKDAVFYGNSGGGLTLSGGEPLMQPEFVIALLKEAKRRRIHCAIETSFYAKWEVLREIAGYLDYILMDIKSMDEKIHMDNTGVSNKLILENVKKVREEYPDLPMRVRTPVIPGVNDSEEAIGAILDFLAEVPKVQYELLKYHRLGLPKYESLFRPYPMGNVELPEEDFLKLKKYAAEKAAQSGVELC